MRTTEINKHNKDTAKQLSSILKMPVSYTYTKKQEAKFFFENEDDHLTIFLGSNKCIPYKAIQTDEVLATILYIFKLDTEILENSNEIFSRKFKRNIIGKMSVATKYL